MQRYRNYGQHDDQPLSFSDRGWRGVNARMHPSLLPQGMAAGAVNMRFRNGIPETRGGLMKISWMNRRESLTSRSVLPFGQIYGRGTFNDPNGVRWELTAADGQVTRVRPNNSPESLRLPAETTITGPVRFVQAFSKCVMFRGTRLSALVVEDVDAGFKTISHYLTQENFDYNATYGTNDEIVFPPLPCALYDDAAVYAAGDVVQSTASGYHYVANTTTTAGDSPEGQPTKWDLLSWRPDTAYTANKVVYYKATLFTCIVDNTGVNPVDGAAQWSPVVHRLYQATGATSAGNTPASTPNLWTYVRDLLPNAASGLFLQNRLFVPHDDLISASDIFDIALYVPPLNEFRINQGSADKLVAIAKFNDTTIIALKEQSVYAVQNVYTDLSAIQLNELTRSYGCVAPEAVANVGKDLWFLSQRGVVSLIQTEQNKLQGVELPVSDPIQPLLAKINWNLVSQACAAYWDNKFYLSVPLLAAPAEVGNLAPIDNEDAGWIAIPVTKGRSYMVTLGPNTTLWANAAITGERAPAGTVTNSGSGTVVALGDYISLHHLGGLVDATVTEDAALTQTNNAVFVYDFLNQAWAGYDSGPAVCVQHWFTAPFIGQDRLWAVTADNFINLYEEGPFDQVGTPRPQEASENEVPEAGVPMNVAAAAVSDTQINVTWTNNTDDTDSIFVYRKTGAGDYALVATLPAGFTVCNDQGLTENTAYTYQIRSGDSTMASSAAVTATTFPSAPGNLLVTDIDDISALLVWDNNSAAPTVIVARSLTSGSGYVDIATVAVSQFAQTQYTDQTLKRNKTYFYTVRAHGTAHDAASNEAQATTLADLGTATTRNQDGTKVAFGGGSGIIYPAGTYRITYTGGALSFVSGATSFVIQGVNPEGTHPGIYIEYNNGTTYFAPAPYVTTSGGTQAAAEAANNASAGTTYIDVVHNGGTIKVWTLDSNYSDNQAGSPNPTYRINHVGATPP